MVERGVREGEPFGAAANEPGKVAVATRRRREHVGALVEPDDATAVTAPRRLRDEPGPRSDVEDDVVGACVERRDEGTAPPRVLAERKQRTGAVVRGRDAGEDAARVGRRRGPGLR
ncbi:MAG: hypothetical protein AUI58_07735 [Chloroflexi bacterium 13_1_40CM_2_70_6]|nr:MAG: hypothetical protein AUI58_07735 [Chloroflexi bacterium 13_1_40CM_2_70_6]